ncbi:MAG TPA: DUF4340 domain-containing protein [Candidatus Binatia bacterium]
MSFVRTLVLLVVASAMGAWLYFYEEPKAEQEARANILLDFEPATIDKLRLAYPDNTEIVAQKDGDNWKLTAPVAYPADKSVVENFLNTIKETKIERRLAKTEAGPLATYGLDGERGSQARVELTDHAGKALAAIVLGGTTPVGYQAFARKEGNDDVLVIPLLLQSSAKKTPFDLRSKVLFESVDDAATDHVTIARPANTIDLVRVDDAHWKMNSPIQDAADTETVRSMIDSIATIDTIAFFDGPQADRKAFGLDETATHFTATMKDGKTVEFLVGKTAADPPAGNYLERSSDHQVVKVPDWTAKKFSPEVNEVRDKRLVTCKVDEIRSMTWGSGAEQFTISRDGAGKPWKIAPELPDQVLNQRIVDNALNEIVMARADEVFDDAKSDEDLKKWGLDAPIARFEASADKGSCGALIAAEDKGPQQSEGGRDYIVKEASRTAVMRANDHEYSRLSMKRAVFVEPAPKAAGSPPAAGAPAPARTPAPAAAPAAP